MIKELILKESGLEWIDVQEPSTEDIGRLTSEFSLPHLLVLDCLKPEHLPKFEETAQGHFLMMRSFDTESSPTATTVQDLTRKIALLTTEDRLVTIHRVKHNYLTLVSEKLTRAPVKNLAALVHEITLQVIRSFDFPIERLQNQYEAFEDEILSRRCRLRTEEVHVFRRQIFIHKRILKQTEDALYRYREFWTQDLSLLQDLRENIEHAYFSLDELSDGFDHLFQLNVSMQDQRANDIMKTLTVFSSILLPLNFMASFYGMNFSMLPGLHSENFFYILCALMVFTGLVTLFYFHHRGWFHFRRKDD